MKLGIVLAYGGAKECCERHLPYWAKWVDRMVFFIPKDDSLDLGEEVCIGRSEQIGQDVIDRVRAAFAFAESLNPELLFVWEYDSLFFSLPPLPPEGGVASCVRLNKKPRRFGAARYLWFPQIWDGKAVGAAVKAMDGLAIEHGYSDRYLGLVAQHAGVPLRDWRGSFHGQHTIALATLHRALKARRRGAVCFHGIKSRTVLDALR